MKDFQFPAWTWSLGVINSSMEWFSGNQNWAGFLSRNIGATQMFRKELRDINNEAMAEQRRQTQ